jgi:hypothetical protein
MLEWIMIIGILAAVMTAVLIAYQSFGSLSK